MRWEVTSDDNEWFVMIPLGIKYDWNKCDVQEKKAKKEARKLTAQFQKALAQTTPLKVVKKAGSS